MKKTACVTGADRGLGFYISEWLLKHDYTVFAGQYMEESEELTALKDTYPDQLELVPLDIGSDVSVKRAARLIAGKTRHVDLIVNNAGIIHKDDDATMLVELDYEVISRLYNVNTLGALRVSNALMGLLLQGSRKLIVNISSEAGSISRNQRTNMYGYCMSKSALNMQSSLMHNHLKELGGQVMVFHPGWLQSYMNGQKNEEATTPPDESASKIMTIVQDAQKYLGQEPAYLDLDGNPWPW
ncbi:SDR family NAD(P)-dependent oxidoreductase [Paenibacillus wynnii]|uniref:Short-chain dehydrogenase n=1 Tax=Paenibacillus wynnii TaxID=268407 RepID=A0A098MD93_9BACL|nr:SDR family NAD(P)-dependent oxidoreductase [Paenibacillus wynnii]KGE19532.1 short-chain dehydrogenase [Paenibacillus wynnii]